VQKSSALHARPSSANLIIPALIDHPLTLPAFSNSSTTFLSPHPYHSQHLFDQSTTHPDLEIKPHRPAVEQFSHLTSKAFVPQFSDLHKGGEISALPPNIPVAHRTPTIALPTAYHTPSSSLQHSHSRKRRRSLSRALPAPCAFVLRRLRPTPAYLTPSTVCKAGTSSQSSINRQSGARSSARRRQCHKIGPEVCSQACAWVVRRYPATTQSTPLILSL
jgi:hypothetical protein